MADKPRCGNPTLILLLRETRRVAVDELRSIVKEECGIAAAATVVRIGENAAGGEYLQWQTDRTPSRLGTYSQPYVLFSEGAVLPAEPRLLEAWSVHKAFLYVDALNFVGMRDDRDDLAMVLRIGSRFVDDRCLLLWLGRAGGTSLFALPTAESLESLRRGEWPGSR
ncbi:MAG: hypothetical protein SF069_15980 [Phycisphaerae bacterium]|nr:hypothetical protein [Phycisphaerae bacterium]